MCKKTLFPTHNKHVMCRKPPFSAHTSQTTNRVLDSQSQTELPAEILNHFPHLFPCSMVDMVRRIAINLLPALHHLINCSSHLLLRFAGQKRPAGIVFHKAHQKCLFRTLKVNAGCAAAPRYRRFHLYPLLGKCPLGSCNCLSDRCTVGIIACLAGSLAQSGRCY